jgi:hypothetical protein
MACPKRDLPRAVITTTYLENWLRKAKRILPSLNP